MKQRLEQALRDGFGTHTYRVQVKSGEWVWVETSVRLSQAEDGGPRGRVARDVTERVR